VTSDDNGVCFIPQSRIVEVLERAQALSAAEDERNKDVSAGMSIVEVANKPYFKKIQRP
jgi:regulator of RNase E activity RraA